MIVKKAKLYLASGYAVNTVLQPEVFLSYEIPNYRGL